MPPAGFGTGSASGSRSGRCHDSSSADESIAGGERAPHPARPRCGRGRRADEGGRGDLRGAERLTVIGHENPDADTLGAALAILMVGERLGIPTEVVMADPVPTYLRFLPRVDEAACRASSRTWRSSWTRRPGADRGDRQRPRGMAGASADREHRPPRQQPWIRHGEPDRSRGRLDLRDGALLLPDLGVELDDLATALRPGS